MKKIFRALIVAIALVLGALGAQALPTPAAAPVAQTTNTHSVGIDSLIVTD